MTGLPLAIISSIIALDTTNAVKSVVRIPTINVKANPCTGPVPNRNNIIPVINDVVFESKIAFNALLNPSSTEALNVLPLDNSSLTRSNTKIFASTAIPIVNIIPAIPGNVNVPPPAITTGVRIERINRTFIITAKLATIPAVE